MLITAGLKDEEIRTVPTRIPKSPENRRFAIYASHSKPSRTNIDGCRQILEGLGKLTPEINTSLNSPMQGHILGIGSLVSCKEYTLLPFFMDRQENHLNRPDQFSSPCYGWQMVNVYTFQNPIPFKFNNGAVIWSHIDDQQIMSHIEKNEPEFNWDKPDHYLNESFHPKKQTYQKKLFQL